MSSSAAGFGEKLRPAARVFQFSFCIGRIRFLNWRRWRRPRIWLDNVQRTATDKATGRRLAEQDFVGQDLL
jgi:hypothetical protein